MSRINYLRHGRGFCNVKKVFYYIVFIYSSFLKIDEIICGPKYRSYCSII